MIELLKPFLLAFAIGWLLTKLLARHSHRLRLMALPRADRWHKMPTPNTGGIAICGACAVSYCAFAWGYHPRIALAAAFISAWGFLDDRVQLSPAVKFLGQAAAVAYVIDSGVVFRLTNYPPVDIAISFLFIAGITNSFNLIDNMDGLCAGVTIIVCLSRIVHSIQIDRTDAAVLPAALAGAFLGFLIFNYRPASIFMGDSGSMLAGFSLSCLTIAADVPHTRTMLTGLFYPALTFLYPIFDTTLVSIIRRASGRPVSVGGRDHSSHRLASLGLDPTRVVWMLWLLTAVGSAAGAFTYWMPTGVVVVASLLIIAVTVFGVFLGSLPGYEIPDGSPFNREWLFSAVILTVEALLAGVSLLLAFLLRWEAGFSGEPSQHFVRTLPVAMSVHVAMAVMFRTYRLGWRWFGLRDATDLAKVVVLGTSLVVLFVWSLVGIQGYSRAVIATYVLLMFVFSCGLRATMRLMWHALGTVPGHKRAAVVGRTEAAAAAIAVLQQLPSLQMTPVLAMHNGTKPSFARRIHGVPVHVANTAEAIAEAYARYKIEVVIVSGLGEESAVDPALAVGRPILQLNAALRDITPMPAAGMGIFAHGG